MTDPINIHFDVVEFNTQLNRMKNNGVITIYENQENIAKKVYNSLMADDSDALYALVVALTQSGKTGSMIEVVTTAIREYRTPPRNIFIITGLSSTEWKNQTVTRFPEFLKVNILHRNDVGRNLEQWLHGKTNVLIIMDEIHMAAKETQTIANAFRSCKLDDPEFTLRKNIRIVEYSATPDGVLRDRLRLESRSKIVIGDPGKGYVGPFELLARGDVFQAKDLSERINVVEMYDHIQTKFDTPKYHIIRVHTRGEKKDSVTQNFIDLQSSRNFDVLEYDYKNNEISDLNNILIVPPEKHTFIFVKDMLRCAKTIEKMNIGIVYERMVKSINDTAIIQGLLGRMTGYDVAATVSVFTNIDTIKRYKLLWDSGFSDIRIPWNSNTKNSPTYAIDKWCTGGPSKKKKNTDIHHRFFEDSERFTSLVEFTRKHLDWTPRKHAGIESKELQNHTSQEIANRKWGINIKSTRRMMRGCDGIWVVWWAASAFDV